MIHEKRCVKCGSAGPFSKDKYNSDGLNKRCRSCVSEYSKKYYRKNYAAKIKDKKKQYKQQNAEKIITANRFRIYGITQREFDNILSSQNGACKICKIKLTLSGTSVTRACIDHCHKTNIVRGILCQQCNKGIGHFNDNPELMKAGADYLLLAQQRPEVSYQLKVGP